MPSPALQSGVTRFWDEDSEIDVKSYDASGRRLNLDKAGRTIMYAAIRQMKVKTGTADELAQRIKDAIPIISGVEGFMGYYVIYAPDDMVTTISVFSRVEEAEESNRRALAWIDENLGPLLVGAATATAGPVIVHSLP
jgi:hypothetical protein